MARSETILGDRANRSAFLAAAEGDKCFVVMAFIEKNVMTYSRAAFIGSRENWDTKDRTPPVKRLPSSKMLPRYRVIVTPKQQKMEDE